MADETPGAAAPATRRLVLREAALTAAVAAIQVGGTLGAAHGQHEPISALGLALLAVAALLVPLRLRFPTGALAATFAATLAYLTLGNPPGPVYASLVVTFGYLVLLGRRRSAVATLVAGYLAFPWLPHLLGDSGAPTAAQLGGLAAWLIALYSVFEVVRNRRDRAREEARSQAEILRRQAADERLRIARDLHDVVAHHMSLIHLQAGVALHRMGDEPDPTLLVIKDASKEALAELRQVLGVLRHVDDAPRGPTPGLEHLDDLLTRAEAAGLHVELHGDDALDGLPRTIDLAAYRIVQESLTNVARHSNRPQATVRFSRHRDRLLVEVLDEGTAPPIGEPLPSGGNGIAGMRERAAAVGGHLDAAPRPGRGFRVRAELPLEEQR